MGPNQGTFSVPGTEEMVKYPARLQNCYEPVSVMCFLFYTFRIEVSIVAVMSFPHYCLMGVYRADNYLGGGCFIFQFTDATEELEEFTPSTCGSSIL